MVRVLLELQKMHPVRVQYRFFGRTQLGSPLFWRDRRSLSRHYEMRRPDANKVMWDRYVVTKLAGMILSIQMKQER